MRLFLIPLIIVAAAVGIMFLIGRLAGGTPSFDEALERLKNPGGQRTVDRARVLDATVAALGLGFPQYRAGWYSRLHAALALLEDTGYRVIDHFYTSGATELGGLGWKTRLMKGPRQALYAMNPDAAARVLGGYSLMVLAQ